MNYTVQQGDCICSISSAFGLFWETVWNDPSNSDLRSRRDNPNVLCEADVLFVPELRIGSVSCPDGKRHRFVRKGVPTQLKIQFTFNGKPREGESYQLISEYGSITGTLDSQGYLLETIPCGLRDAVVRIGREKEEFELAVGSLDPVSTVTGIQARLNNLGYACGQVDGLLGPKTRSAVLLFQRDQLNNGLKDTGNIDSITTDRLVILHGC